MSRFLNAIGAFGAGSYLNRYLPCRTSSPVLLFGFGWFGFFWREGLDVWVQEKLNQTPCMMSWVQGDPWGNPFLNGLQEFSTRNSAAPQRRSLHQY